MNSTAYAELLKDPRWQKNRLMIMERDDWSCQVCGSNTGSLAVHHRTYIPSTLPWDYPNDLLATLCEPCHSVEAEDISDALRELSSSARQIFFSQDIYRLADWLSKVRPTKANLTRDYIIDAILEANDSL